MKTSIYPVLITVVLTCFALSPLARAVDPPPDGGYPHFNTAEGEDALFSLTDFGVGNTAIGYHVLYSVTQGDMNTGTGYSSLALNTTGCCNTATGSFSLYSNTTGFWNTANGYYALENNSTGSSNTASGYAALTTNTTGSYNTAAGLYALVGNTTGKNNTATGAHALGLNTTGDMNTATGVFALLHSTGSSNVALGYKAGGNITIGHDNIHISNRGATTDTNIIRIGTQGTQTNAHIAGISGVTVPTGVAVIVDADGHLGTTTSSARFKEAVKAMDKASEAILALQPVTFRYKHDLDPKGIPQFGLVAEEVEKINPDLVARDEQNKPYTVRYEAVNAMLLNEFLKEHRKNEEQEATIAQLKAVLAKQEATAECQQKQIEALTAGLQKVSTRLEVSRLGLGKVAGGH